MTVRPGLLGLALVLAISGTSPAAAQTSRPEIVDIRFEGNQVYGDGALEAAIVNRETSCRNAFLLPLCLFGIEAAVDRGYLDPDELPRDALRLQAYYWLRGYRDARVEVERDDSGDGVALTFRIVEGEPVLVEELTIEGTEDVAAEGLLDDLPLSVGEPMSSLRIEAVRDTLVSRLREVGYAHADVFSGFLIPADSRAATVDFTVDPGPVARFGPIQVGWAQEGTPQLDEITVRRMVPFSQGSLYRFSQLVDGQRNLYSLDLVETARVTEQRDTLARDTIIPVNILLTEGDLHRVRTGVGWSTADCFNGELRWTSRNFRGGARRLTARGRISNILAPNLNDSFVCSGVGSDEFTRLNGQLAVELIQPFVFSPRNSVSASAFVERQSVTNVYIREAIGTSIAFTREIGRQATLAFSYQPALTRLEAGEVFFCISFLLCTAEDIQAFSSANWLSPIAATLALNRSNRLLNPTAGYSVALSLEYASSYTLSDFVYARALGEVAGYLGLGERTVLAARVRGGNVRPGAFRSRGRQNSSVPDDLVHPQKRFYAGGAASVRGFAENQLGPRVVNSDVENLLGVPTGETEPLCLPEQVVDGSCDGSGLNPDDLVVRATGGTRLLEASLELRFPLYGNDVQGATFLDVGQVWDQQSEVELDGLELTPGVGVRYFSPIGPIRLDVGYRFRGAQPLPLLTNAIEPCTVVPGNANRCLTPRTADGTSAPIPWTATDDLRPLGPRVLFGGGNSFWDRLQLHFSIGQAF
ncbi:MAG: BamA/TamA family outer membrane protein [Gemmatimonadota bacterium]